MSDLAYTLLTDGSSDRMLQPVLDWLLLAHARVPFTRQWADLRQLRVAPSSLRQRIDQALALYPCDLLFVHRDAEKGSHEERIEEIAAALDRGSSIAHVPVIPVRMMEAWFLFDEDAIRRAAGNPAGNIPLPLPTARSVERLPDPKEALDNLLRKASELSGRRLENLRMGPAKHRVAELITDYSPLRQLSAFSALETQLVSVLTEHDWIRPR